jgi:hypothetical protein
MPQARRDACGWVRKRLYLVAIAGAAEPSTRRQAYPGQTTCRDQQQLDGMLVRHGRQAPRPVTVRPSGGCRWNSAVMRWRASWTMLSLARRADADFAVA